MIVDASGDAQNVLYVEVPGAELVGERRRGADAARQGGRLPDVRRGIAAAEARATATWRCGEHTQASGVPSWSAGPGEQGLLAPALVPLCLNGLCSYSLLGNVVLLKVKEQTGWTPWAFPCSSRSVFLMKGLPVSISGILGCCGSDPRACGM